MLFLRFLFYSMFLSMGHFKMFQPDRKAFFKTILWEGESIKNSPVLYMVWSWDTATKYYRKKLLLHSSGSSF